MKRIFITGYSGMVGKHLLQRFNSQHVELYLFNRGQDPKVLIDFQPDVVFHLAAEIYDEQSMFESNIELTYALLEAAREVPRLKAFIAIGSSSEYGRKDHPISETDFLDPTTMYEATKGAASLLCLGYHHVYNIPTIIARPFSLYGKFEPQKRLIPTVISNLKTKKEIFLSPGVHDFIHVDDFIDGLFLLEDAPKGQIYNFGTGIQTSNKEVVDLLALLLHRTPKIKHIEQLRTYDSSHWVADITKARQLGWEPKYSFIEGLSQVLQG